MLNQLYGGMLGNIAGMQATSPLSAFVNYATTVTTPPEPKVPDNSKLLLLIEEEPEHEIETL